MSWIPKRISAKFNGHRGVEIFNLDSGHISQAVKNAMKPTAAAGKSNLPGATRNKNIATSTPKAAQGGCRLAGTLILVKPMPFNLVFTS
jgi:hypothetical protein